MINEYDNSDIPKDLLALLVGEIKELEI